MPLRPRFRVLEVTHHQAAPPEPETPPAAANGTIRVRFGRGVPRAALETAQDGATMVRVECPDGVGGVSLERLGDRWPKTVRIRLPLRGLEGFDVSNGRLRAHAFVSTQDGSVHASVTGEDQVERVLAGPADPLWTAIRWVAPAGAAPKKPAVNGYFEVTLPAALLVPENRSLLLHWVDFYRG